MTPTTINKLTLDIVAMLPQQKDVKLDRIERVKNILQNSDGVLAKIVVSQIMSICPYMSKYKKHNFRKCAFSMIVKARVYERNEFLHWKEFIAVQYHYDTLLKHLEREIKKTTDLQSIDYLDTMADDLNEAVFQCLEKLKDHRRKMFHINR